MNTKATAILLWVFELLAVFLVIFIITGTANAYSKSETVTKINAAEDLRMMVNILVGVPGEAQAEYPHNVSALTFILRPESITVFKKGDPQNIWIIRIFSLPEGYTAEGVLEEKERLCLVKRDKKILLRECT